MTEDDERPDAAKLAGRALRALRAQQADPEAAAEPDVAAEEPAEAEAEAAAEPDVAAEVSAEVPADVEAEAAAEAEAEPVSLAKPDAEPDETPLAGSVAHDPVENVGTRPWKRGDSEPSDESEPSERAGTNYLLIVSAVLVVLALAFAVIGFVVHQHGSDSPSAARATARDDAATAARIDIATLQTLDYKNVKAGLDKWLAVTTGSFHDDIAKAAKSDTSAIASAKRVTVGKVLAAAVTELDTDKGTATVIASVEVRRTPEGGQSTVDRNRYRASLTRVDDVWKISNLGQVPVALS